jgi:hypothetical protein
VNSFFTGSVKRYDGVTGVFEGDFISGLGPTQGQLESLDGQLLVGRYGANRIDKFDINTGAFIGAFASTGGLVRPNNFTYGPVPEPATVTVLLLGLAGIGARRRRCGDTPQASRRIL